MFSCEFDLWVSVSVVVVLLLLLLLLPLLMLPPVVALRSRKPVFR